MSKYHIDLRDIEFNLFESFKLSSAEYADIIREHAKFVASDIYPTRQTSDEEGVSLKDGIVTTPKSLKAPHKAYYENGWFALGLPEEIGGTPVPELIHFACISMITGANAAWSMYPSLTKGVLNVLRMKASDELKNRYIPSIVEGKWGGSMCLTEPGAGSDVGAARTTAQKINDKEYHIKGVKIFISSGENDLYENIIHLVLARLPGAEEGTKGLSLFLVPKFLPNAKRNGVLCTKIEHKMGIHASATCELTFGQNEECIGYLIGEENLGMDAMFIMMNEERLMVALQGEAQANLAFEIAKDYAFSRKQFGVDLTMHPDVRKMLLKMRAKARGLRALCMYAAQALDLHDSSELGVLIPIAKAYCSDQGFQIASEAVQVLGGYGYCSEYGVEQFIRDTKIAAIYEGTNGIQAMDLVMRKILKDRGAALHAMVLKIKNTLESLPSSFKEERTLFERALDDHQKIVEKISDLAGSKQFSLVLQKSTDILDFYARLIVGWRLMAAAIIAGASSPLDDYYQSKLDDFKVYCEYDLASTHTLAQTIIYGNVDVSKIKI